jgi:ribosome modulation factor
VAISLVGSKSNVTDATLQKHIQSVSAAKEALDEANSEYRAKLKAAKADGVNQKQLVAALLSRKRDVEAVRLDLRDYVRYLGLCAMRMTQQDLFGDKDQNDAPGEDHLAWQADQEGFTAGKAGRARDDQPYEAGSAQHAAWVKGWLRGQKTIAKTLAPGTKIASTRRKRGRSDALPFDA